MTFVAELEPKRVWKHFDALLAIPRASGAEAAARAWVVAIAEARGLAHRADAAGNLVVTKPGARGGERAPTLVLQSHLDMVCEKNADVTFDFAKDALVPRHEGAYLKASGTTLGSDNGIGVASMLAVAEADDLAHPPLELLFTVEEETGLIGASKLDAALVSGRRMLNLDTEEEGSVYVGCAGGAGSEIALPLEAMFPEDGAVALTVRLSGLKGGHSGVDIHLQRGNAIQLLARSLWAVFEPIPFEMSGVTGGNMLNAIPREAEATVLVAASDRGRFASAITSQVEKIRSEFMPTEPEMKAEIAGVATPRESWTPETTKKVLGLLDGLPHGVVAWSRDLPDLVETSVTLARVRVEGETLRVHASSRSSSEIGMAGILGKVAAIAALAGADVVETPGYPGWKPDMASPILARVMAVSEKVASAKPAVKAIHAGLECGILGERCPGMDMVSIGPQIEFPHSPDERVEIGSVGRFWTLLAALLADLATR